MLRSSHTTLNAMLTVSIAVVVCMLSAPAFAGDVKLLKQPSAFPLLINNAGSYRLKSNITVPDANTTAISITADNVTLDLNGYSITGPTMCSGGPPVTSCTPTGTGNGIDSASGNAGITVLNGTVQGMGHWGLHLGSRARIEKVRAVSNGFQGISTDFQSTLVEDTAVNNGDSGIVTSSAAVVSGNVSMGNLADGISAGGLVSGNTTERNAGSGLTAIDATVIGNRAGFNNGAGLVVAGGEVGYANNVFRLNTFGSVLGGGTDMGHNDCNGSTTCP
jgi:hypothetical protein